MTALPVNARDKTPPPTEPSSPQSEDLRLERIGYRLAAANSDRCARPEMLTGLMLHDQSAYEPKFRPAVTKAYGLTYGFGVRQIVPGSSGERAGLQRNDEIVAIDGKDLRDFGADLIGQTSSYNRTGRFVALFGDALRKGQVTLTIRRAGATTNIPITGELGCGGRFVLVQSRSLNAWADGTYVAVTTKMMRFARTDDELAFVVAHEMSHNILGHEEGASGSSSLFAEFGLGAKAIKNAEIDADSHAVGMLARAGFDLTAPERFLRHSGKSRWMDLPITHPGVSRRVAIVNEARSKLETDNAAQHSASLLAAAVTAPNGNPTGGPTGGIAAIASRLTWRPWTADFVAEISFAGLSSNVAGTAAWNHPGLQKPARLDDSTTQRLARPSAWPITPFAAVDRDTITCAATGSVALNDLQLIAKVRPPLIAAL